MLVDSHNRRITYLRLSVTDKCNLRCRYCMPPSGVTTLRHDEVLRNEEFAHLVDVFVRLGVDKIRITGGEPLLRKGLMALVGGIRERHPGVELGITTNGIFLHEFLDQLCTARVARLNISLDTLSARRYREITGADRLDPVIANIEKALRYDYFTVKINTVLLRGLLDELDDFLGYFAGSGAILRFIEKMPFGNVPHDDYITADDLTAALGARGTLVRIPHADTSVARMYDFNHHKGSVIKIGIIPPLTHKFCRHCNRLRLTCDGMLKTCLHASSEYDLKTAYRTDSGDEAIQSIIERAVLEKPSDHGCECRDGNAGCVSPFQLQGRGMSGIGG